MQQSLKAGTAARRADTQVSLQTRKGIIKHRLYQVAQAALMTLALVVAYRAPQSGEGLSYFPRFAVKLYDRVVPACQGFVRGMLA